MIYKNHHGSCQHLALVDGAGIYVNMRFARAITPPWGGKRLPVTVLPLVWAVELDATQRQAWNKSEKGGGPDLIKVFSLDPVSGSKLTSTLPYTFCG